ncbi:alpha/beta fold hydrolase [Limosilactobacillus sp.]|uniref:alpha/beta fold hydrolase n=1 Tax=Limosilactobacillus sp. TaxID=2773925 RepID=UPI0025BB8A62|nr:alpha/beta hydrolase [Limosilactobacillus sp.]MCH3923249.1 alpha/beta hydrolase [Limosilactobacillus sp.]MCH3927931.1 alpha/beta hydrolase [Limosilactobacillus sp.]
MTEKKSWYYGPRENYAVMWEVDHPVGIIQIVHGMIEYTERYDQFAHFANRAGYIVVGNDHVGHGKTVRQKDDYGKFPDEWESLVEDVRLLKRQVQERYPNLPYTMLGHSMGSYIVRLYLAKYGDDQLAGAILMGTGQQSQLLTGLGIAIAEIIKLFRGPDYRSKLLEQLSTGSFNRNFRPNRTRSDWINRDPREVDKYLADTYQQFRPTVNMYRGIFNLSHFANKKKSIQAMPHDLPLLIISGAQDPVGDFGKGVRKLTRLLRVAGCSKVTLKLFKGARHEILHEYNKEEVMQYIIDWIGRQYPRG